MRIFAFGDPHLSFDHCGGQYKPMDIFGEHWDDHSRVLQKNWVSTIKSDDVILMPGDISWAMTLAEAQVDLDFLGQLPGQKIITRGNHDLWWDTISKVRQILPPTIKAIQNDHVLLANGIAVCGTRGWLCADGQCQDAHDSKVFAREVVRLALSLASVPSDINRKIVMLHFPPTNWKQEKTPLIDLLLAHQVETCIYGHLHGAAIQQNILQAEKWGIQFHLVSADYLQFKPKCIYNDKQMMVGNPTS